MQAPDSERPEAEKPQAFFGIGFDPLTDATAFPHLSEAELEEVAPLGERCTFDENEPLFSAGDYPYNGCVIVSGRVRSVDVSTGERVVCVRFGAGYFTGDIDLLTRRPAPLSVEADTAVEAIRLTPRQLRMLFTRRPQLGEKMWRSYQRRRELLLTSNFRGLTVYGEKGDKATVDTLELLFRNSVPHEWVDISIDENRRKLQELREDVQCYPVVAHGCRVLSKRLHEPSLPIIFVFAARSRNLSMTF
jgi:thioredoxin reductase (NADPH)